MKDVHQCPSCGGFCKKSGCERQDTQLQAALAQPEQEPLEYWNAVEGWVKIDEVRDHFDSVGCGTIYKTAGEDRVPLYTLPPQREWVGLTKEEIVECVRSVSLDAPDKVMGYILAAQAALKEKNT